MSSSFVNKRIDKNLINRDSETESGSFNNIMYIQMSSIL